MIQIRVNNGEGFEEGLRSYCAGGSCYVRPAKKQLPVHDKCYPELQSFLVEKVIREGGQEIALVTGIHGHKYGVNWEPEEIDHKKW